MSQQMNDTILLLHAPDGSSWANFMSSRLEAQPYEIKSITKDITILEGPPEDDEDGIANGNNVEDTTPIAEIPETDAAEDDDDVYLNTSTSGTISNIINSRACIIFLSPDIIEGEQPFPIDITLLNPRRTVFLFLGVEFLEVRQFFATKSEFVFKCRCCHIDGSNVSICDALLQIVQSYEDTGGSGSGSGSEAHDVDGEDGSCGGTYVQPSSLQANSVEKVFPNEFTGDDREVYVLFDMIPEHDVVAEVGLTQAAVPLKKVCDRLYSFTLPENLNGKVPFTIGSCGHTISTHSVRVVSKLEKLHELLSSEAEPRTLLTRAFGLEPGDDGGLDTALAFRLQQLASARSLANLFPVEASFTGGQSSAASKVMYPSLLHFAADYNLRTFCQELLRYPGMAGAAKATNSKGETPYQIASRKNYRQLADDLSQISKKSETSFSRENSTTEVDDELYVQPSPPLRAAPPPTPHRLSNKTKSGYVNDGVESYMTMRDLPSEKPEKHDLITVKQQLSQVDTGPTSGGRDFPETNFFRNDVGDDDSPIDYHNLDSSKTETKIRSGSSGSRHGSNKSKTSPRETASYSPVSPLDSPRTTARKALMVMGVTEDDVRRSGSPNVFFDTRSSSLDSDETLSLAGRNRLTSVTPPRKDGISNSSTTRFSTSSRQSLTSNHSIDLSSEAGDEFCQKQPKSKMSKIKNIFKPKNKRSSSISDIDVKPGVNKQDVRRGSESTSLTNKSKPRDFTEERDSGSYSDEDKDKPSPSPVMKRPNKHKGFQEREKAMSRRLSRRAQAAVNEKIEIAPTLPSRAGRKKGAFKSFIEK